MESTSPPPKTQADTPDAVKGGGLYKQLMHQISAALSLLDPSLRREYDEARQHEPQLVANETRFIDFLRTDNMDAPKAAQRLALYWKRRKEVFGPDRWLRPMTQTGHGALTTEDILFLRTGYTVILPRPSGGGPIALADLSKLDVSYPQETNTRIIFYFVTVMTDVSFQTEGATILQIVTSAPRPPVETNPEGWNIFREALPCKVKQLVVVQAYEPWKEAILDSFGYQVACTAAFKVRAHPNRIVGNSTKSVMQQLAQRDIPTHLIPRCCGGTYDYSSFDGWTRVRLSIEDIMSAAPLQNIVPTPIHVTAAPASITPRAMIQQGCVQPAQPTDLVLYNTKLPTVNPQKQETKLVRKRANRPWFPSHPSVLPFDLIALALPQQRQALQLRNEFLRQDNRRLEGLLAHARLLAAVEEEKLQTVPLMELG